METSSLRTDSKRLNRRQYLAVAATTLVAGCVNDDDTGDSGDDGDSGGGDTDGGDDDGGSDDDGETDENVDGPQYTHFQFEEGEQYQYEVTTGGLDGSLRWEVTEVDGDQITVHLEGTLGAAFEETVTGTRDTIRQRLADTQFGELITSGLLTPYDSILQDRPLAVGNRWSATTSDGSAAVRITGTDSYAGIECYIAEIEVNGVVRYTACLSPDMGLVLHSEVTPDGETVAQGFELVGHDCDATLDDDSDEDDNDGDDDGVVYTHFEFEEGARYEYDLEMGGTPGTFVWEITEVSGDEVTVRTEYELGGVIFETKATGTRGTLEREFEATPAGPFMHLGVFHVYYDHYENHELRVDNSWSASTSEGSATYEVTGTDSHAGLECYVTELYIDGNLHHEGCVSPELGLVAHSVIYDQTGTKSVEMTLTDYSSG